VLSHAIGVNELLAPLRSDERVDQSRHTVRSLLAAP
jgi:hypothetical protein